MAAWRIPFRRYLFALGLPPATAACSVLIADGVIDAQEWILPVWVASLALVGFGTYVTLNRSESIDVDVAVLLLAALLMSPLGWVYYVWFTVGPLVAVWKAEGFSREHAPGVIAMLVPLAATVAFHGPLATVTLGSTYAWGMLCLWLTCLRLSRVPRQVANPLPVLS